MKKPSWWNKPITWGNYATMCVASIGVSLLCTGGAYAKIWYDYRRSTDELKQDFKDLGIR